MSQYLDLHAIQAHGRAQRWQLREAAIDAREMRAQPWAVKRMVVLQV